MEHLGVPRLRLGGGVAFGGSLVRFPIEATWRLAFVEVKRLLNFLLPARQSGQAFGVFKRRFNLGLGVRKSLAGVGPA